MSDDSIKNPSLPQSEDRNVGITGQVGAEENPQASTDCSIQARTDSDMQARSREVVAENIVSEGGPKLPEITYQQLAVETLPPKEMIEESCMLTEGNIQPIVADANPELMNKDDPSKDANTATQIVHLGLTDIVNAVQVLSGNHRLPEESGSEEQDGDVRTVVEGEDVVGESARVEFTVEARDGIISLNQGLADQNHDSVELHSSLIVDQSGVVDGNLLASITNEGLPEQTTHFVDISSENPQSMEISSDYGNVMVNTLNLLPRHRKDPKVYACTFCVKTFSQPHQLVRHERMHTGEKPFICDICGKGCSQKGDLVRHKRKHTGERPYKCDLCEKAYFKSADLKYHKRKHTGEKPYKCTMCDKAFTGFTTLRYHIRTHSGEKPYQCDICKKAFSQSTSLKLHKATHSGERPFECDLCEKKFSTAPALRNHKSSHAGGGDRAYKSYQCDICNKTLSHLSSLICHKRTHTGEKPFKCDQCDKAYSQSFDLKRHKAIHTGSKNYKCEVCDKAFYWAVNLREHKKQHEDNKPFKCDMCDKTFAWSSALGHHKRRHNGEKPFKCETCGKTYAAIGYLNRHIKSKHSKTESEKPDQSGSSKTPPSPTATSDKSTTE